MAIPKPMITWDSYFDDPEASVVIRRPGGSLRADNRG